MLMRMFKESGRAGDADKVNITMTPFYKAVTISRQYYSCNGVALAAVILLNKS